MSKKTILLILLLIAVTGVLLYVAFPRQLEELKETVSKEPEQPQVSLSLSSTSSGALDILIDTAGNEVSAIEFDLVYDPRVITNVALEAGDFFESPYILDNRVNTQAGVASYAIAIPPQGSAQKGSGTLAKITFRSLLTSGQTTQIQFLQTTKAAVKGSRFSVVPQTSGTTISK